MAKSDKIEIYLEIAPKRSFAGAIQWPGWCRSGKDEESALQALFEYGPRYAHVVRAAKLGFCPPAQATNFVAVERLKGNATTEFGAPGIAPSVDSQPIHADELRSFEKILNASWRAFDESVEKASGKSLRSGPRGGGRQLEKMIEHVLDSNEGYLNQVGWKLQKDRAADLEPQWTQSRQATLAALQASARGEIPPKGPRGGLRWTARYFVRRLTWHILDHAWEIEDRLASR